MDKNRSKRKALSFQLKRSHFKFKVNSNSSNNNSEIIEWLYYLCKTNDAFLIVLCWNWLSFFNFLHDLCSYAMLMLHEENAFKSTTLLTVKYIEIA